MTSNLNQIMHESAKMEQLAGKYYFLLSERYLQDRDFWWRLYLEEMNHSSVYESFLESYIPLEIFPIEIIDQDIEAIRKTNLNISVMIKGLEEDEPEKRKEYEQALKIEASSSEGFFQEAIKIKNPEKNLKMIQKVVGEDIEHKERIEERLGRVQ